MSQQQLRDQLYASFRHRAILYYLIFDDEPGGASSAAGKGGAR